MIEEKSPLQQQHSQQTSQQPTVDPFEFQEDPIVFEPPTKPSGSIVKQDPNYVPHYQQQQNQSLVAQSNQDIMEMENVSVEEVAVEKQGEEDRDKIVEESQDVGEDTKVAQVSQFMK